MVVWQGRYQAINNRICVGPRGAHEEKTKVRLVQ